MHIVLFAIRPMIINTQVHSLVSNNQLRLTELNAGVLMERLSSGLRINRGADDPSGLAIASGMRAQIRGYHTAQQNLQDGVNMLLCTDAGLNEIEDIVIRMRDLSVRGANDATLTMRDKQKIQDEISTLALEISRITQTHTYNTKELLSGREKILFYSERSGAGDIYTIDPDGANPTNLSLDPTSDSNPSWSPDGSKIAFVSNRTGNSEIFVMDADGANLTNITNDAGIDLYPMWSPDGSKIAIYSRRGGDWDLYVMNADGSYPVNITSTASVDNLPIWSPDGTRIAFVSNRTGANQIYTVRPDGTDLQQLTTAGVNNNPSWSPDGSQIAFDSTRDGNLELYVMDADGAGQTNLTNDASVDVYAKWSADGSQILFSSRRTGNTDIYVMNADGSNVQQLTNDPINDFYAEWSPDGSEILFHSARDGNYELYTMNADGSDETNITNNGAQDYVSVGINNNMNRWFLTEWEQALHVGPDSGHVLNVTFKPVSAISLGVAGLNVSNVERAGAAIELCDSALNKLNTYRAELGAITRRLQHTIDDNAASYINITAAESRIRDTDMAQSIADFTRVQIMQQAGLAVRAQADVSREQAMSLLLDSVF